jgi:hypothetical protein
LLCRASQSKRWVLALPPNGRQRFSLAV